MEARNELEDSSLENDSSQCEPASEQIAANETKRARQKGAGNMRMHSDCTLFV